MLIFIHTLYYLYCNRRKKSLFARNAPGGRSGSYGGEIASWYRFTRSIMEALVTSYLMMKNVEWRAHEEQEILVGRYSEIEK